MLQLWQHSHNIVYDYLLNAISEIQLLHSLTFRKLETNHGGYREALVLVILFYNKILILCVMCVICLMSFVCNTLIFFAYFGQENQKILMVK